MHCCTPQGLYCVTEKERFGGIIVSQYHAEGITKIMQESLSNIIIGYSSNIRNLTVDEVSNILHGHVATSMSSMIGISIFLTPPNPIKTYSGYKYEYTNRLEEIIKNYMFKMKSVIVMRGSYGLNNHKPLGELIVITSSHFLDTCKKNYANLY